MFFRGLVAFKGLVGSIGSTSPLPLHRPAFNPCSIVATWRLHATDADEEHIAPTTASPLNSLAVEKARKSKGRPKPELPTHVIAAIKAAADALQLPPTKVKRIKSQWLTLFKRAPDTTISIAALQQTIDHFKTHCDFNNEHLAEIFAHAPELLRATVSEHIEPTAQVLANTLAAEPQLIRNIFMKKPDAILQQPAEVTAKLQYLIQLGIPQDEVRRAVMLNPTILTTSHDQIMTTMAFLLGSGFKISDINAMLWTSPKWLTISLTELTVKWDFFRQEMKGRQVDLVLWPQILERNLLETLGPRTGFARKKRLKMLMPSLCWGHPLLTDRKTWREGMVVPVLWYMTASPTEMCRVLNFSHEDFVRYKRCWLLTTGQVWRKRLYGHALPNNAAYNMFRAGLKQVS